MRFTHWTRRGTGPPGHPSILKVRHAHMDTYENSIQSAWQYDSDFLDVVDVTRAEAIVQPVLDAGESLRYWYGPTATSLSASSTSNDVCSVGVQLWRAPICTQRGRLTHVRGRPDGDDVVTVVDLLIDRAAQSSAGP